MNHAAGREFVCPSCSLSIYCLPDCPFLALPCPKDPRLRRQQAFSLSILKFPSKTKLPYTVLAAAAVIESNGYICYFGFSRDHSIHYSIMVFILAGPGVKLGRKKESVNKYYVYFDGCAVA